MGIFYYPPAVSKTTINNLFSNGSVPMPVAWWHGRLSASDGTFTNIKWYVRPAGGATTSAAGWDVEQWKNTTYVDPPVYDAIPDDQINRASWPMKSSWTFSKMRFWQGTNPAEDMNIRFAIFKNTTLVFGWQPFTIATADVDSKVREFSYTSFSAVAGDYITLVWATQKTGAFGGAVNFQAELY